VRRWWRDDPGARDIAAAVLFVCGYVAIRQLWWGSASGRETALALYYAPIYFVAALAAWSTATRSALDLRARGAWALLGLGALCTATSDAGWLYTELVHGVQDTPPWVDAVALAGYPCMIAGLLTFRAAPRAAAERVRFWIDVTTVLVGGTMLAWFLVVRPVAVAEQSTLAEIVQASIFPLADLVVLVSVAVVLARGRATAARRPLQLLAIALVFGGVGDLSYAHERLVNSYHPGDAIDWLWLVDGTLIALAARLDGRSSRNAHDADPIADNPARGASFLPYVAVAVGFMLLFGIARPSWHTDIGEAILGVAMLTLLVVGRQMLVARDNVRLLAERAAQEARFRHEALHDPLTGLANRGLLIDRAGHAIARTRRQHQRPMALVYIDLDNFKTVNDSLGHAAGDALLVEASRRLVACVRDTDTVARLGGDEFAIFIEDQIDGDDCSRITSRVMTALRRPFSIERRDILIGASLGVAAVGDTMSATELLRNADAAMYMAKTRGKGRCETFAPEMRAAALDRVQLEADLRRAITPGATELVLHYQPIVILASGRITGVEALVRWHHPRRGLLMPSDFVGLAEETGLILPLGAWIVSEACRQLAVWQHRRRDDQPTSTLAMTVNVSGRQMQSPQIVADVRAAIARSGIDPRTLILELTESVLTEQTDSILATLHALKALGVRLAIDDFGTGYSSLSYLQRFPIDILKIAKSFVDEVGADPGRHGLAQAIVTLGSALSVRTVAEGIERPDQRQRLQDLGCELGQGFYFSPPVEAEEIAPLLHGVLRQSGARRMQDGQLAIAPL
jgi:diguanylate cyclase (GGDEF)-like protein